MLKRFIVLASLLVSQPLLAQERVQGVADREALFHSVDPVLNERKQIVYKIYTEIFENGHYELVDRYMTERYLQYNPNIPSGREAVKKLFRENPLPKMTIPVFAVIAEGDLVVVASAMMIAHPTKPGETYTTTHFDMWRFVGNRVDEHWDEAQLGSLPGGPATK